MSHVWIWHATRMSESCCTWERVMPYVLICLVTRVNASRHTYKSRALMSHVARMNESCYTYETQTDTTPRYSAAVSRNVKSHRYAKEPCISIQETHISIKELYLSAQQQYLKKSDFKSTCVFVHESLRVWSAFADTLTSLLITQFVELRVCVFSCAWVYACKKERHVHVPTPSVLCSTLFFVL